MVEWAIINWLQLCIADDLWFVFYRLLQRLLLLNALYDDGHIWTGQM